MHLTLLQHARIVAKFLNLRILNNREESDFHPLNDTNRVRFNMLRWFANVQMKSHRLDNLVSSLVDSWASMVVRKTHVLSRPR